MPIHPTTLVRRSAAAAPLRAPWLIPLLVLLLVLSLGGCDRRQAAWEQAEQTDTVPAYQEFVQQYPDAEQVGEARVRIAAIEQAGQWERARSADSIEAYREFLADHPDAPEAAQARGRLAELEPLAQWEALQETTSQGALRAFVQRYPDHPSSVQARQRIAELEEADRAAEERERAEEEARQKAERERQQATATHRVQLAAFRSEAQAETAVATFGERHAELFDGIELESDRAGSYYRVRTGPMERAAAGELCERLKSQRQDCLVVVR